MKKSYVMIAIILIVLSTSCAFAHASDSHSVASPRYSYIMDIFPVFVINSGGNSAITINVSPIDMNTVDRATATVTIRNLDTGASVVTWRDQPFSVWQLEQMFNLNLAYRLPVRGTYMMEATISLYDGSILRERVNVTSNAASF